jgi:hypothetical protein
VGGLVIHERIVTNIRIRGNQAYAAIANNIVSRIQSSRETQVQTDHAETDFHIFDGRSRSFAANSRVGERNGDVVHLIVGIVRPDELYTTPVSAARERFG